MVNETSAIVNDLFTFVMDVLSPKEIIEQVKILTGDRFDSDLAKRLDIDKQSFPQYKNKTTVDLQQKIISLLLTKINATDKSIT
ncbi:hypothetical protein AWQ21_03285 [Picosynechococcus sp. PCC 7003]|uniref:hypothetical protein n=1 Tax=Picosynechococcus sp. PCC 7003 TaxID=374981 RepID=UPI0008109012|nr:hypothetical protein [Picosynechococcus sp. PCC 7003]ANV83487.1 hypothetical protein AWQ21_03285 [Picosynechococcus sp. PCC 7003]